jgi:hypothetical protein
LEKGGRERGLVALGLATLCVWRRGCHQHGGGGGTRHDDSVGRERERWVGFPLVILLLIQYEYNSSHYIERRLVELQVIYLTLGTSNLLQTDYDSRMTLEAVRNKCAILCSRRVCWVRASR